MEARENKTIMCSVLFLDIVEYSKMSVSGQISVKERFNSHLSAAISDVPVADRIILDTGDGAAINFLGDVQDALKTALNLRESLLNEGARLNPPLLIRAGINLGPVRLVRDINGQPNIVGDGINVAQRIMGFADVDQILVSRSYHDAVSRLSSQYAEMFTYQGSRTDKHVREHEVYTIGHLGEKTAELIATSALAIQKTSMAARFLTFAQENLKTAISWSTNAINTLKSHIERADSRQRAIYAGAIVVPVILIGMLILMPGGQNEISAPPVPELPVTASAIEQTPASVAPATEGSKVVEIAPIQPATAPKPDTQKTVQRKPAPRKSATSTTTDTKTITQPAATAQPGSTPPTSEQTRSAPPTSEQPRQAAVPQPGSTAEPTDKKNWLESIIGDDAKPKGAMAHIAVRCDPGTKVFVDGVPKGEIISRVLVVDIPEGTHTVIATGSKGMVYSQKIKVSEGRTVNVRPDFCN